MDLIAINHPKEAHSLGMVGAMQISLDMAFTIDSMIAAGGLLKFGPSALKNLKNLPKVWQDAWKAMGTLRVEGIKTTFGGALKAVNGKTTTLLGSFTTDMERIIGDGTDIVIGKNIGGFNVLNITDWSWSKNKKWLLEAIKRDDVIRFTTDPSTAEKGTIFYKELHLLKNNGYEVVGNVAKKIEKTE